MALAEAPTNALEIELDIGEAFRRLRALQLQWKGKPKHDQVTILIAAAIDEGFIHGPRIVGVLHRLGYDKQFAGMMLVGKGCEPTGRLWSKVGSTYHLAT